MKPIEVRNSFENPKFPTRIEILEIDGDFDYTGDHTHPKYTFSTKVMVQYSSDTVFLKCPIITCTFWTRKNSIKLSSKYDGLTEEEVEKRLIEGLHNDLSFYGLEGLEKLDLHKLGVRATICRDEHANSEELVISAINDACGGIEGQYLFSSPFTWEPSIALSFRAISAEFIGDIYYDSDGNRSKDGKFVSSGEYTEKVIGRYDVSFELTGSVNGGLFKEPDLINIFAVKGTDVVATLQKISDEFINVYGPWSLHPIGEKGEYSYSDQKRGFFQCIDDYTDKLFIEHECKVECWDGAKKITINGENIFFYVNDNGAIIEFVEVRPNTFEDGFYYETGCTVDIDLNVYNEDFSEKVPLTLTNVDTKQSCYDWFDDYWEGELDHILSCEDENGNYDGPEQDKGFYLAAKECQDNNWDFCDEYNWNKFRTEEHFENYCWDLITNTDYTFDQMAQLDEIWTGIPRIEKADDIFVAVDVEGTFRIYECGAQLGDDMLFGDILLEGSYVIKGIKWGTEKEMMDRTINALCKWAREADYDDHSEYNQVCINRRTFDYGHSYPSTLKEPIVEVKEG